jgi:hypothetical protein
MSAFIKIIPDTLSKKISPAWVIPDGVKTAEGVIYKFSELIAWCPLDMTGPEEKKI